jgi:hypothetical protein
MADSKRLFLAPFGLALTFPGQDLTALTSTVPRVDLYIHMYRPAVNIDPFL